MKICQLIILINVACAGPTQNTETIPSEIYTNINIAIFNWFVPVGRFMCFRVYW